jgi:hypothetical protein
VNAFLEAFDGYVPLLIAVVLGLLLWKPISEILTVSKQRIDKEGVGFKIGSSIVSIEVGQLVKNTADVKKQAEQKGSSVEVFGEPDQLKLLFKVQGQGWKKSTKAIELPSGCLVQVTTERQSIDGDWTTAEALQFVPNVKLVTTQSGTGYQFSALGS